MLQDIYITGNHTNRFSFHPAIGPTEFATPTLWHWLVDGPEQVAIPDRVLSMSQLDAWVQGLKSSGYEVVRVGM